jgi:DNA-3-methyladenine glycosylase II
LAKKFNGVRPPRFPTLFEALVNAVSCQQISLDAGIALLNRFTETYGLVFSDELNTAHAFPRPEDVFDVPEGDLRQLGFSHQKARAIKEAAYAVASGSVQPGQLELMSNERALVCLRAIHGIGRWSAEYVLLRGLGRLDVFPGDDIGGQNNVQILLGLMTRPDYEQLKELSASWQPYAGFVYFHLLLNKLHGKGSV